jgi:uncharacterized paraquat-inducible protein A
MTPKELAELNAFREKEGLPPLTRKERSCMKCKTKFITIDNRLCNRCNIHNKAYQNADESRYSVNYIGKK